MRTWLIDTGPIVAYLDGSDGAHEQVAVALDAFSGQLATTSAVITEAMHLVAEDTRGPRLLADFAMASGLLVHDLAQASELQVAAALMERYSDTPMDYADATLVMLADVLGVSEILTLDQRGFSVYRPSRRRSFRLVLA